MTKKILGIGNAIVDILCKVDDEFLITHDLTKGTMSLIGGETAHKLLSLKAEKTASGGSAGNTIAALAQLGAQTAFIGKLGKDDLGDKFISEIEKTGTKFLTKNRSNNTSAKSFVLVTPDTHRTMCTYLGCASEITEADIVEEDFKDVSILYLEGYLWDVPETILALKKAIKFAKKNGAKVAFTTSDPFCVLRHKKDFLQLVKNDLDILFANEMEVLELVSESEISTKNLSKFFAKNKKLTAIVTRSEKGCIIFGKNSSGFFQSNKVVELPAEKIDKLTDSTGAGDAFAAGFLYAMERDMDIEKCGRTGNRIAAKIIQKFGARFDENEIQLR